MKLMLRTGEKESGHRTVSVKRTPTHEMALYSRSPSSLYHVRRQAALSVSLFTESLKQHELRDGKTGERKQLSLYGCGTGYPKILFFPSLLPSAFTFFCCLSLSDLLPDLTLVLLWRGEKKNRDPE